MERAQFSYHEIASSPDLEPYILSFWAFEAPTDLQDPIEHEIFPDGCSSLLYWRNYKREIDWLGVSGLQLETIKKPICGGDTFWGMRLSPAACSSILRIDPNELFRMKIPKPAAEFPVLTTELAAQFTLAKKFEQFVLICEERMRELISSGLKYDSLVSKAVGMIANSPGEIRVDQLAADVGMSTRQFQRRFKESSGLTPKQFLRARRIRATVVDLVENDNQNWASRAADLGFADQAHLTHEFVSITNRSPRSFAKKLSDISHGLLIK